MHTPADARRRWFGAFFLTVAGGLLIWGQTILKPHLAGFVFIVYWLLCFGFTGLALLVALLDIRAMRKHTEASHRELFKKTLLQPHSSKETAPPDAPEDKPAKSRAAQ